MTKVSIETIVTREFRKLTSSLSDMLVNPAILPTMAIKPDYAIMDTHTGVIIAVGGMWQSLEGIWYSAKWDIATATVSDVYILHNDLSQEYFSSQIDPNTLEPIMHYIHDKDIEYKIDSKNKEVLQVNHSVGNGKAIASNIEDRLRDMTFPYIDKVILTASKPYGEVAEFRIDTIVLQ